MISALVERYEDRIAGVLSCFDRVMEDHAAANSDDVRRRLQFDRGYHYNLMAARVWCRPAGRFWSCHGGRGRVTQQRTVWAEAA
jgi:hypothetical protein